MSAMPNVSVANKQFSYLARNCGNMMLNALHQFLLFACVEASGALGVESFLNGPYCFGGHRSFLINNVEKDANFSVHSLYRRFRNIRPNLVCEMLYSGTLFGPMGSHATMQQMLATPDLLAGIIVKVNYPWNNTDPADNYIILVYYLKDFGQHGPYPPAFVKVLGRPLTSEEILLLQDELGVVEGNIQGNGINGCGKCLHGNPSDNDVYTFTIPASSMLMGAEGRDYVTIDGAEVKLSALEGGLTIKCQELMEYLVIYAGMISERRGIKDD